MNSEQALRTIKLWKPILPERVREAFPVIEEALEKQIAIQKHKYQGYRCGCGKEVAKDQEYCEYCGQKLLPWDK